MSFPESEKEKGEEYLRLFIKMTWNLHTSIPLMLISENLVIEYIESWGKGYQSTVGHRSKGF